TQPTSANAPARAFCWSAGWVRQLRGFGTSSDGGTSAWPTIRLRQGAVETLVVISSPSLAFQRDPSDGCPPEREVRVQGGRSTSHGGHQAMRWIGEVWDRT